MENEKNDLQEIKIKYVNKTDPAKEKPEYYSIAEAVKKGMIKYKKQIQELITHGDAEGDYETIQEEGYHVLNDNIYFVKRFPDADIKESEIEIKLKQDDVIQFDKKGNLNKIIFKELSGHQASLNGDQVDLDTYTLYCNQEHQECKDKKYIELNTKDIIETQIDGKQLFFTNEIIVDKNNGKIVGGYLCSNAQNKNYDYWNIPYPAFSCDINGNKLDIERGSRCFVLTKDGKVVNIEVECNEDNCAKIKYNGKEMFIPKKGARRLEITKIDNSVFWDKEKSSGVNFRFCGNYPISDKDIDEKYANTDILNCKIGDKKLREEDRFDITYYNNNCVLAKNDNALCLFEDPNNGKYQLTKTYHSPELEYKSLKDKSMQNYFDKINNTKIKNKLTEEKNLSKTKNDSDEHKK